MNDSIADGRTTTVTCVVTARRRAIIAGLLVLVATLALTETLLAEPVAGPDIFDFEAYPPALGASGTDASEMYVGSGVVFQGSDDPGCQRKSALGGWDGGVYVRVSCTALPGLAGFARASFAIGMSRPRSTVELFVRVAGQRDANPDVSSAVRVSARRHASDSMVDTVEVPRATEWTPVVLRDPNGAATIESVTVEASYSELHIDDVGLSTTEQPDTQIDSGPPARSNQTSATFGLRANQPLATFRCAVDNGAPYICPANPAVAVSEGTHTLTVAAVDRWGEADPSPATYTWTVDATPPDTAIGSGPASSTPSTAATFAFSSPSSDVARFECSLDRAAFATCDSPETFAALTEGPHELRVRAIDTVGNADPTPATRTWTVLDTTPPDTAINSGPPASTPSTNATFAFSSPSADVARFECSLDGAAFTACASPQTVAALAEGPHEFRVRAVDAAGNFDPTPAGRTWTVLDTTPPDTAIDIAPPTGVSLPSASVAFSSPSSDVARFECSLDGAAFATCTSPVTVIGLGAGSHVFEVRAVDVAGNRDPTPAQVTWTILDNTDPDRDKIPSRPDNCPNVYNPDQSDVDGDDIGDACEVLSSGDLPPSAGKRVRVRLQSGRVYVRLPIAYVIPRPRQAQLRVAPPFGFGRLAAPATSADRTPIPGAIALKGIASVPVGATVDTRFGSLSLASAANASASRGANRRLQSAIFSGGIFRIRQARRAPARATKTIPLEAVLGSVPQATRTCATAPRDKPPKTIVRTLHVETRGVFRVIAGAARTTGRNAEWTTSDRCDGTLTHVDRGRVTVARPLRRARSVTVRAENSHLMRARLFSINRAALG